MLENKSQPNVRLHLPKFFSRDANPGPKAEQYIFKIWISRFVFRARWKMKLLRNPLSCHGVGTNYFLTRDITTILRIDIFKWDAGEHGDDNRWSPFVSSCIVSTFLLMSSWTHMLLSRATTRWDTSVSRNKHLTLVLCFVLARADSRCVYV